MAQEVAKVDKSKLLREDKSIERSRHGVASANGKQFLYRRPDGEFLFSIYQALFLRIPGVTVTLDRATFLEHMDDFQPGGPTECLIHVYLDLKQESHKSHGGFMNVTFSEPYKGHQPKFPSIKEDGLMPNQVTYTVPLRYISFSQRIGRHYVISFKVTPDMTAIPEHFYCPYIQEVPGQVDKLVCPEQWITIDHARSKKTVESASAPAPDKTAGNKKRPERGEADKVSSSSREEPPPKEVVAQRTLTKKPRSAGTSAPEQVAQDKDNDEAIDIDALAPVHDPQFKQLANYYAIKRLLNDKDLQTQAMKLHIEKEAPAIVEAMRKDAYAHFANTCVDQIKADPQLMKTHLASIRAELKRQYLQGIDESALREEFRQEIHAEELKKIQARQEVLNREMLVTDSLPRDPKKDVPPSKDQQDEHIISLATAVMSKYY